MRHLTILAALAALALPSIARAEGAPGYVNTNRVRVTATEPKRLDAEFQQQRARDREQVEALIAEAKKKEPSGTGPTWTKAIEANDAMARKGDDLDAAFLKKLAEVLGKVRVAKHVTISAGPGLIIVPGVDLTDDVIGSWNASDAQGMAAELAKARAELAAAKSAKAPKSEPPKK